MKIFISHSSKGDDYAAMVRELVLSKLLPEDKPLVDMMQIKEGDDWCAVLYHWLAICDAAVILLNRKALTSLWVRREANILLWRNALNRSFRVVPALLGDIERGELKQHGLDDVNRLQLARIDRATETQADAEELAARIMAGFTPRPAYTKDPMAGWVSTIAGILRHTEAGLGSHLGDAAQVLGITGEDLPGDWTAEGHRLLASQMLGAGLNDRLEEATAALIDAFDNRGWVERLISEVSPSWVDGEAARRLLPVEHEGPPQRRVLILNADDQTIGIQYVARATFNAKFGYEWINATCGAVGAGGAEELSAHFENVLRDEFCPSGGFAHGDLPHSPKKVYYLLVHVGRQPLETVGKAVQAVHAKHPWLVIVLLVGPSLPDEADLESAGLGEAVALIPPLGSDDEPNALQLLRALDKLPEKAYGVRKVMV